MITQYLPRSTYQRCAGPGDGRNGVMSILGDEQERRGVPQPVMSVLQKGGEHDTKDAQGPFTYRPLYLSLWDLYLNHPQLSYLSWGRHGARSGGGA